MALFKVYKETTVPSKLEANAIYFVAPESHPDYVEIYVTNNDGTKAKRILKESDINTLIDQKLSSINQLHIVQSISDRNGLSPTQGMEVFVIDATTEQDINKGGARYIYNNNQWLKVSETESMDLNLSWDNIQNKPNKTASEIEEAVNKSHSHENITTLNELSDDGQSNLLYKGKPINSSWEKVEW